MATGDDALAQFRRKRDTTESKPGDKWQYQAFKISPEPRRFIEIRKKYPESADAFSYGLLTRVAGERLWGFGVTMLFAYGNALKVTAEGKKLQELFQAVQEARVEWIQEFDPSLFHPVSDETIPIIETIEIVRIKQDGTEETVDDFKPQGNA